MDTATSGTSGSAKDSREAQLLVLRTLKYIMIDQDISDVNLFIMAKSSSRISSLTSDQLVSLL